MVTDFPSNTRALLARSAFAPEFKEFALWLGSERYTPFVTHLHLLRLEQSCLDLLARLAARKTYTELSWLSAEGCRAASIDSMPPNVPMAGSCSRAAG